MNPRAEEKRIIRSAVRSAVASISADERQRRSMRVCDMLQHDPRVQRASRILAFWPLPDEVDIRGFIERECEFKEFYLPVVQGDSLLIKRYTADKVVGAFNIMEPVGTGVYGLDIIDLVIVPGVAFDLHGGRIGRGKGFYDRLLAGSDVERIGVCFAEQVVDSIDIEDHDAVIPDVIFF